MLACLLACSLAACGGIQCRSCPICSGGCEPSPLIALIREKWIQIRIVDQRYASLNVHPEVTPGELSQNTLMHSVRGCCLPSALPPLPLLCLGLSTKIKGGYLRASSAALSASTQMTTHSSSFFLFLPSVRDRGDGLETKEQKCLERQRLGENE